jgi:HAD superfamily phosphatase
MFLSPGGENRREGGKYQTQNLLNPEPMAEYTTVTSGLQIRADLADGHLAVDAIVFDIDGVLIDVRGSFREAVRETVQYYLKKNYDLDSPQIMIAPDDIQQCKMAGGYNNDWDVAEALVAFSAAKIIRHKVKHLLELKKIEPTLAAFMQVVRKKGGGLENAYAVLFQGMTGEEREKLKVEVRRKEIVEIFQELYAGVNYCQRLYQRRPNFFRGEGKIENEKAILKPGLLFKDAFKYGVFTGRTREEAELALEQLDMASIMDSRAIIADDGAIAGKPDPAGMVRIAETLQCAMPVYCGDMPDDWAVVQQYRKVTGRPMLFCSCLACVDDQAMENYFKQAEVELVARDINDLLKWLILQKKEI